MFIKHQLWPVYKQLYPEGIVKINLYPYGNVDETERDNEFNFECQHGGLECALNTIECCVKHIYNKTEKLVPFVYCVADEYSIPGAEECANEQDLDWKNIAECYKGDLGKKLFHEAGVQTPEHNFIPWIVINGKYSNQGYLRRNLKREVCSKYKGRRPKACNSDD